MCQKRCRVTNCCGGSSNNMWKCHLRPNRAVTFHKKQQTSRTSGELRTLPPMERNSGNNRKNLKKQMHEKPEKSIQFYSQWMRRNRNQHFKTRLTVCCSAWHCSPQSRLGDDLPNRTVSQTKLVNAHFKIRVVLEIERMWGNASWSYSSLFRGRPWWCGDPHVSSI